jgi:hypothetical protein
MVSSSALVRVFFFGEKPPLLHLGFYCFFLFPVCVWVPLPLLTSPGGGPPPCFPPTAQPLPAALAVMAARAGLPCCAPYPPPAMAAQADLPYVRLARLDPYPLRRAPPLPLPWLGGRRREEEEEDNFVI